MTKTLITTSLIAALFAVPAMATQDEIDQKTVTSKYYVDTTKQDIIPTDKVLFIEGDGKVILEDVYVPALVLTNAAGTALNGNTVGIVDRGTLSDINGAGTRYDLRHLTAATYDSFVPTVRAVATELSDIWTSLNNTLFWTSTQTNAVNAYSVLFGTGTNQWSGSENAYITGVSLAQGLALKQNIIAAGTSGNVVTYTGTAGQVGSVGVYNGSTTYNASTDASKLATAGVVNTAVAAVETAKQDKMTCAGYLAGHENDDDYCWLYSVASVTKQSQCLAYDETATSASQCCSGVVRQGFCGCHDNSDCPGSETTCDTSAHVCVDNAGGGKI